MLGPCLTQARRQEEMSTLQIVAPLLRAHNTSYPTDAALASRVKAFLSGLTFPLELIANGVEEQELLEETQEHPPPPLRLHSKGFLTK
jgi:hypothetical protein